MTAGIGGFGRSETASWSSCEAEKDDPSFSEQPKRKRGRPRKCETGPLSEQDIEKIKLRKEHNRQSSQDSRDRKRELFLQLEKHNRELVALNREQAETIKQLEAKLVAAEGALRPEYALLRAEVGEIKDQLANVLRLSVISDLFHSIAGFLVGLQSRIERVSAGCLALGEPLAVQQEL